MIKKLSKMGVNREITKLNLELKQPWMIRNSKLNKTFILSNFVDAFEFMSQVAELSENLNHHPEWSNIYNKVDINLTTHDVDGLSKLDFELAALINKL